MPGIAAVNRSNFQSAVMRLEATQKVQTPDATMASLIGSDGSSSLPTTGVDASPKSAAPDKQAQDKFQEFVAGSFYKLMLKSLRSAQKPSKYFNGGQAEKVFQGQLDEQFTDKMAKKNGGTISNPLYPAFTRAAFGQNAVTAPAGAAAAGAQRPFSPSMLPATEEVGHTLDVTQ